MKELYVVWAGAGADVSYGVDEDFLIFDVCESEDTAKEKVNALDTEYKNNPEAFINKYSRSKLYREQWDSDENTEYDYFFFHVQKITTGQANLITGCLYLE